MAGPLRALASFLRPAKSEPKEEPKEPWRPNNPNRRDLMPRASGTTWAPASSTVTDRTDRFRSSMDSARRETRKREEKRRTDEYTLRRVQQDNALAGVNVEPREREKTYKEKRESGTLERKQPKRVTPRHDRGALPDQPKRLLGVSFNRTRELSWDEYEKLDPRSQAAVQANTLLAEALKKDQALKVSLDTNRDGKVSVAEAGDEADGYRDLVERRLGTREWSDDRVRFAPNMMSTLEFLNVEDRRGGLEDYFARQSMVGGQDLERGAFLRDQDVFTVEAPSTRRDMQRQVAENTYGLGKALADGRVVVDGYKAPLSMDGAGGERFAQLVESLRAGVKAGATFGSLFSEASGPRFNLDPLKDPNSAKRQGEMELLYNAMVSDEGKAGGVTEDILLSQEAMEQVFQTGGYGPEFTFAEWKQLLDQKKRIREEGIQIGREFVSARSGPITYMDLDQTYRPDAPTGAAPTEDEEE